MNKKKKLKTKKILRNKIKKKLKGEKQRLKKLKEV